MSLRELLQTDMKTAMKERESGKERLSVLRMVWAAVRNKEIDEKTELTDDAVMAVLMKEVKQREDTIKEIKDANRPDLVAKNEEEIEILKKYLPEPLSDEESDSRCHCHNRRQVHEGHGKGHGPGTCPDPRPRSWFARQCPRQGIAQIVKNSE